MLAICKLKWMKENILKGNEENPVKDQFILPVNLNTLDITIN